MEDIVLQQILHGCQQPLCQNQYCKSCNNFITISDPIGFAKDIVFRLGGMSLCFLSLRKISSIFKAINNGMTLVDAWVQYPIDEVYISTNVDFKILESALVCNFQTIDNLDFFLGDIEFNNKFFNDLLLTERNQFVEQLGQSKIVEMKGDLTNFIQKIIDCLFFTHYIYEQEEKLNIQDDLLIKLFRFPECILMRTQSPVVCIAGILLHSTQESLNLLQQNLLEDCQKESLLSIFEPIISACNQYISIQLSIADRPRHNVSVIDLIPYCNQIHAILTLMKFIVDTVQKLDKSIYQQQINTIVKLINNDYINSNSYNITPDTDYWLQSKKSLEYTNIEVLPIPIQLMTRQRERLQYPIDMFSLLNYPHILNPGTKMQIVRYDITFQLPHLSKLLVRRDQILEDTIEYIQSRHKDYTSFDARALLRLPIKVIFDGEEGVDAGGLSNEYFELVTEQLFNKKFNLFKFYEGTNVYYINKSPGLEPDQLFLYYYIVGVILGLALINGVIIQNHFPHVFYKKLLNKPTSLEDLLELDDQLYYSLQAISNYKNPDFAEQFCLDFTVREDENSYKLLENASQPVTTANKQLFIQKRFEFEISTSISPQFAAIQQGFFQITDSASLQLLTPMDLQLALCGEPFLDFEALKKSAKYQQPYTSQHQSICDLWEVLLSLDEVQKSDFCAFVFGSRRAPAGGLQRAKFEVHKNGEGDERLPTAHTCFGVLMLPEYSGREVMRSRICQAIEMCNEGFGLQ